MSKPFGHGYITRKIAVCALLVAMVTFSARAEPPVDHGAIAASAVADGESTDNRVRFDEKELSKRLRRIVWKAIVEAPGQERQLHHQYWPKADPDRRLARSVSKWPDALDPINPDKKRLKSYEGLYNYREWISRSTLEVEAEKLANEFGASAVPFLKDWATGSKKDYFGNVGKHVGARLAEVTLAKLASHPEAVEAIDEVCRRSRGFKWCGTNIALFMPREPALSFLKHLEAAGDHTGDNVMSALAVIGDEEELEFLKRLDTKGRLSRHWREYWLDAMQLRLRIEPAEKRKRWDEQELLYRRVQVSQLGHCPNGVVILQLDQRAKFTTEFLRSKLPQPLAIRLIGMRDEEWVVPELMRIYRKGGPPAYHAYGELQGIFGILKAHEMLKQ